MRARARRARPLLSEPALIASAYTNPAKISEFRGEPGPLGDRDHRWHASRGRNILSGSTQGYSRRRDMREAMWSTLEGLIAWAMRRDRARFEGLVGLAERAVTEQLRARQRTGELKPGELSPRSED